MSRINKFNAGNSGKTSLIALDCFSSVAIHQDQVYAADYSTNQTRVFQLNETASAGWHQLRSIDHDFSTKNNNFLTLSISNNHLKFCSFEDSAIKVYSLSGELLQTHGTRGCDDNGQLEYPFIRDDDDDGSVLIADNGRLQVMSKQGEFSVLQLQPPVSRPSSAVLFNDHVFTTSWIQKTIYKYSC